MSEIEALERKIALLEKRLAVSERNREDLNEVLDSKDEEIRRLKGLLSVYQSSTDDGKNDPMGDLGQKILNLEKELKNSEILSRELEAKLEARATKLKKLESQIANCNVEIVKEKQKTKKTSRAAYYFFVWFTLGKFTSGHLIHMLQPTKPPLKWSDGHLQTALEKLLSDKNGKKEAEKNLSEVIKNRLMSHDSLKKKEFMSVVMALNEKYGEASSFTSISSRETWIPEIDEIKSFQDFTEKEIDAVQILVECLYDKLSDHRSETVL